jgi:hypothetical protein
MADKITLRYKPLFSVFVFHHYFLDNGRDVFIFNKSQRQPELNGYDVRQFLHIQPTENTNTTLKNAKAIFKTTATGFVVLASPNTALKENLQFVVVPTDPLFMNYTAFAIRGQSIQTYDYKEDNITKYVRVKSNVPVLTHQNSLFLSKEIPERPAGKNDYAAEDIFREAGGGVFQATADNAGDVHVQQLQDPLPRFVLRGDIQFINPHGIGECAGIELTPDIPDDVFALIHIDPQLPPFPSFPDFEIHFKNRSTEWRYFNKVTQTFETQSPPFWEPLTSRKLPTKRKATPDLIKIQRDNSGNITKLISEINP